MGFSGVAPGGDYATRRRRRRAEQHDDEQGKRGASGIVSALAAGVDRDFHRVALGGDCESACKKDPVSGVIGV